ncbi:MAG: NrdH-redoxin [Amnibacterium sp.]|nr:NrdH-redoxin [Amnibacterium sp.]
MYGAAWCGDCRRSKAVLDASGLDYEYVDVGESKDAADAAVAITGRTSIPVIVLPDGSHLVEPSDALLLDRIGVS